MARKRFVFLNKLHSILKYVILAVSLTLVIVLGHTTVDLQSVQASLPLSIGELAPVSVSNGGAEIIAQAMTAPQLVQQGRKFYEAGQFENALTSWEQAADAYKQMSDETGVTGSAINQAQALKGMGFSRRACKTLVQALKIDDEICENSSLNKQTLPKQEVTPLRATGLRSLGEILLNIGNFEQSQEVLQRSWEIAKKLSLSEAQGDALLSLGNTARALGNRERDRKESIGDNQPTLRNTSINCSQSPNIGKSTEAIEYYQKAIDLYQQATVCYPKSDNRATSSITPIHAQLNQLSLLLEIDQWLRKHYQQSEADNWLSQVRPKIKELIDRLQPLIANLPRNHEAVYTKINFARSQTLLLRQGFDPNISREEDIKKLLDNAIQQAKYLGDKKAEAYAVGNLGWMYEQIDQLCNALKSTKEALQIANEIKAQEIVAQWEWQLGRIFTKKKEPDNAKGVYEDVVNILQSIRKNLTAVNRDAQFSFRDDVEPLYRQLINLVLRTEKTSEPSQDNLKQAIQYIDDLQLAELENFLGCTPKLVQSHQSIPIEHNIDRTDQITAQIEKVTSNKAALIYPIVLEDRVALIFKLPHQPLQYYQTSINQNEVKSKLKLLRESLIKEDEDVDKINNLSKEVYGWLVNPIEESLKKSLDVETLVFVLDGDLRNIPMAVLHDGQKYLVEKEYSIAVAPSLQLIDPKPRVGKLKVLMGGIEKYPTGEDSQFSDLQIQKEQLQPIKEEVEASAILLNSQFTKNNLQNQLKLNSFSVVHLATHGQFSSDPEETFIVAYKERIKPNDLQELIQSSKINDASSIELLVLSVCETAQGDNRAILGLAGIAVKSGAGSTLSTLWLAPTDSTNQLVVQFYKELSKPHMTTAKALHNAQKALFNKYDYAPYNWASYTLVGNWL